MTSTIPDTLSFESHAKILIEASEANIARIESQIRDLECLRDRERGTIAQLRMAIAPVRKMPAELLAKIFHHTRDSNAYGNPFSNSRLMEMNKKAAVKRVQALSHVCAHWRQVAITNPRLWTDVLRIKLDKTPTEAYCSGLKEWLGRSAPFPIPIHLECARNVDARAVFGALLTVAHRWRGAHFDLPVLSVLSRIPSDTLKQLRTLTLRSRDPIANSAAPVAFSLAPNLREVNLHTRHIARLRMPWSQLTSLTVVASFPQECLDSLLQCQNLVTADLSMPAWPDHPDVSELRPITLEKLKELEVTVESEVGSVAPFFACLALPALNRLTLYINQELEWAAPEFTQFQLRSPNIEALIINRSNLGADNLMSVLRHAPAVSELSLEACPYAFDETIATALSASHQTGAQLVPHLRHLTIGEDCAFLEDDTLDALIAARWWTDEQLANFPSPPRVSRWSYISIFKSSDDDDYEEDLSPELEAKLDEYREQGLDVNIY
ncbi:hypothetical protein C8R46DRAFT_331556 [Mycena filopes]|nr:hypothetical protein C8R46DRAFT_331556 [Mycena filopes]